MHAEHAVIAVCANVSMQRIGPRLGPGPQAGRDNSARIEQIMALRHEAAQLLGFANAAEESLATKMADAPARVLAFLRDLVARAKPVAVRELEELRAFAQAELGIAGLRPWDIAYAAEKLRVRQFALSEEELKPYFPLPAVIDGLFAICQRVFGVHLQARAGVDVWHPDVRFYDVLDAEGRIIAGAYVDLYARSGKRGGVDGCSPVAFPQDATRICNRLPTATARRTPRSHRC
jgi:oligopeptidase A